MNYGLSLEDIDKIRTVFAGHPEVERAILYGSRAKGTFRPNSDIDLCLQGDELSLSQLGQLENQLDDLLLPYKIDLSIYRQIDNPALLEHIDRLGIIFYEDTDKANDTD